MLPKDCNPVIVKDAGFKVPWLKQVCKLGWHYVARVRGNVKLKLAEQSELMTVNALYKKARATPKDLGEIVLTQPQQYEMANNIMPIRFFLPAFTSTYFYSF